MQTPDSRSQYCRHSIARADAVIFGDNIHGVLVNPNLFERYFMPSCEKCANDVHDKGKLLASHFDGRLGVLKDLISAR